MPKGKLVDCRGISLNKKRGRWEVQIIFENKRHYLGSYKDESIARKKWEEGRNFYYGTNKVVDLDGEVWMCMTAHNSDYYVSNKGRVKNLNYEGLGIERLLSTCDSRGYRQVKINRRKYFVHKIEAWYFLGETKLFVNHIDGNKANNNIENLEYTSYRGNICHRYFVLGKRGILPGAHFDKTEGTWRSEIRIGKELFYFGNFLNPQLASDRYMEGLLELGLIEDYNYIRKMLSENS